MTSKERATAILDRCWFIPDSKCFEIGELIASAIEAAVAEEREACAKLADAEADKNWHGMDSGASPEEIASMIRSRGRLI